MFEDILESRSYDNRLERTLMSVSNYLKETKEDWIHPVGSTKIFKKIKSILISEGFDKFKLSVTVEGEKNRMIVNVDPEGIMTYVFFKYLEKEPVV